MQRFLQNRIAVGALLVALALLATFNWYQYMGASSSGGEGGGGAVELLPHRAGGTAPGAAAFAGASEGLLQIRTRPGESPFDLVSRYQLGAARVLELSARSHSVPDDPRLVLIPRTWVRELTLPRDPFLYAWEEPKRFLAVQVREPRPRAPAQQPSDALPAPPELVRQLQVLVRSSDGSGTVSAGGRILRTGDRVGEYAVTFIGPDSVFLRHASGFNVVWNFVTRARHQIEVQLSKKDVPPGEL